MRKFHTLATEWPIPTVFLIIAFSVGTMLALATTVSDPALQEHIKTFTRYAVSITLITVMARMNWAAPAGISGSVRTWHARWPLAMIPMMLIGLLNLIGNDWGSVTFTLPNTTAWVVQNFGVGLFEEVLLRGVCFYILARAWREQSNGLMKAAIAQGLIFGLLHFLNVSENGIVETTIQVVYATLLGVGFAGLVVFTRSIWPAVIIHTFINLMGSSEDLMTNPPEGGNPDIGGYLIAIALITLLSTLPGTLFIRKAQKEATNPA